MDDTAPGTEPLQVVEVEVEAEEVDLVSGLLWGAGVTAVAEHHVTAGAAEASATAVVLRADVPSGGLAALERTLSPRWAVHVVTVTDDGADGWRAHAATVDVGRRLRIRPAWLASPPGASDRVEVVIEPGRSFGHGAHPTTTACLELAEDHLGGGARVLDVGCGSGVVGVAAARLGAAEVIAVDIDPGAIRATEDNATRNGVSDVVQARLVRGGAADVAAAPGPFDLVVANIGAATITTLWDALVAAVAPGGWLILSGLLDPPPPALLALAAVVGRVDRRATQGWCTLTVQVPRVGEPGLPA